MSFLPSVFLPAGSDKVKILSLKMEKQTIKIEKFRDKLWTKIKECDLQTNKIAAQKDEIGNLRMMLVNKTNCLREQMELVNSLRLEAQTSAVKHQQEIKELKTNIEEISEALKANCRDLTDNQAEMFKLSLKHITLKKDMEDTLGNLSEVSDENIEVSSKLQAKIAKHGLELGILETALKKKSLELESKSLELLQQTRINDSLRSSNKEWFEKMGQQKKQIQEQEAKIVEQVNEIKSLKAELTAKLQQLGGYTKTTDALQDDVRMKADLLREQENKIEENAMCIQKQTYQLQKLEKDKHNQAQQLLKLEGDNQAKSKKIQELESKLQFKTKKIEELQSNTKEHNKSLRKHETIIALKNEEIKTLRLEVEVKSSDLRSQAAKIMTLTGALKNVTKRREHQVRTIAKIKKANEDKSLIILEKDALLCTKENQLEKLKALLDENVPQIVAESGEIVNMKKKVAPKQLKLQSQLPKVKYLHAYVQEQKEEEVFVPAWTSKTVTKRERQDDKLAITHRSKRLKRTE